MSYVCKIDKRLAWDKCAHMTLFGASTPLKYSLKHANVDDELYYYYFK